jgi:hypothetical protein
MTVCQAPSSGSRLDQCGDLMGGWAGSSLSSADLRARAPKQVTTRVEPENTVTGTLTPGRDPRPDESDHVAAEPRTRHPGGVLVPAEDGEGAGCDQLEGGDPVGGGAGLGAAAGAVECTCFSAAPKRLISACAFLQ